MQLLKYTLPALLILSPALQANESSINDFWKYSQLYKSSEGNYLNLSGRLQADAAAFADSNEDYNDILWRRFRFGFKAKYGHTHMTLEGDFDLNDGGKYNRLTDANLSWTINKDMKLTVLKQSAGFTLDGRTSSKKLLTPQRNNLTNNLWFTKEYFSGVSVKGSFTENTTYKGGIYSSDDSDEIGLSEASYFALMSFSSSFDNTALWDKGEFSFDYVYNDTHVDAGTKHYSQVVSLSSKTSSGQWHLWNDISYGKGELGRSDLWGLVVMPFYQQTSKIQWVVRYTYIDSADNNGIGLGRYEKEVTEGRGNNYQELYAGVNYLFNEHKLKVHLGGQYTEMQDDANDSGEYDGWGVTLALRSYW